MKYGKQLHVLAEQMPVEYRDKFLSYKQLKKVINNILQHNSLPAAAFVDAEVEVGATGVVVAVEEEALEPAAKRARGEERMGGVMGGVSEERVVEEKGGVAITVGTKRKAGEETEVAAAGFNRNVEANIVSSPVQREAVLSKQCSVEKELTIEEEDFLRLLNVELEKFNHFFTEQEEIYVIRLQELKQKLERLRQKHGAGVMENQGYFNDDLLSIRTGLVTLHGELVLMESYSSLNYTGLVKILKKHDKRTGAVLRLPFIKRVLLQPFFSTELLTQLVKGCEKLLLTLPSPPMEQSINIELIGRAGDSQSHTAEGILKSAVAALRTIQEIRKGSSTVSALSLPPCNLNGNDERYGTIFNEGLLRPWGSKLSEHSKKQKSEGMACAS
uniref:SPX domain-containing protein n=1 Tax=Physcomitrium patens TaxID=3218 RepID=A0A7I4BB87_PHYPA